jgi:hypothetical protein
MKVRALLLVSRWILFYSSKQFAFCPSVDDMIKVLGFAEDFIFILETKNSMKRRKVTGWFSR